MAQDPAIGRRYAGQTHDERREQRRARLRAACLEVVGTQGWAATTVQGVCSAAGVTSRTFYEEHGSMVALLAETYAEVLDEARSAVTQALLAVHAGAGDPIIAGLQAYLGFMTDDPRRARLAHREVRVAGVLDEQRHAGIRTFADIVAVESGVDPLTALALTGAVNEVLVDWVVHGGQDVAQRIEALQRLFRSAVG